MRPQMIGFDEDASAPRDDHPFRFWLLFILVFIAAAWFYAAPYITFYQLREAAKNGDIETLSEMVNFPLVKESIKEAFKAHFTQAMVKDKENPFAALGILLTNVLIDPMVDAFVSPSNIEAIARGQRPQIDDLGKSPLAKTFSKGPSPQRETPTVGPTNAADSPSSEKSEEKLSFVEEVARSILGKTDARMRYDGISRFSASFPDKETQHDQMVLILRRDGIFSWKLTAVRLPVLFDKATK